MPKLAISGIWMKFLKINGITHYLWRAVDQNGVVLDILVQPKRDRFAASRFFRKLLRATGRPPRVIITDKRGTGILPDRMNRNGLRVKMIGAGRMTATARA